MFDFILELFHHLQNTQKFFFIPQLVNVSIYLHKAIDRDALLLGSVRSMTVAIILLNVENGIWASGSSSSRNAI